MIALMNTYTPASPMTCMSIVSGPYKYTYWWYEDEKMKPAEELFHLGEDPLELTNLAVMAGQEKAPEEMRVKYDTQLKHWQTEAVKGNGYQKYITLFDRHLPLAEKDAVRAAERKKKERKKEAATK